MVDVSITSSLKRDWEDPTGRKLAVRNPSLGEGRLGQNGYLPTCCHFRRRIRTGDGSL